MISPIVVSAQDESTAGAVTVAGDNSTTSAIDGKFMEECFVLFLKGGRKLNPLMVILGCYNLVVMNRLRHSGQKSRCKLFVCSRLPKILSKAPFKVAIGSQVEESH